MSSMRFRFIFRSFGVVKLWNVWYRNNIVNSVVKRWRERCVREVFQCFKYAIRPRRTFLLSVTAAFRNRDEDDGSTFSCDQGITDDELEALVSELKNVEQLAKMTLYCTSCGKRLVIDRKQNGVSYCMCKEPQCDESSDGWVPFMEAEDVIIWRKEYKPGQGLYAYKVYGRYPEVCARDFAAVQIDGAYRRAWDAAVAALAVVQRRVHGVPGQAVLHWEVLWPRLFANRDYVYIRRHKEFEICAAPLVEPLPTYFETTSVHAKAKRKAMEANAKERDKNSLKHKVFVIISRSCEHPDVPETKHAIRVLEYWSHMVVKTIHGDDKPGMEFVLTYYDEPAVGGMPGGVAAWASGRAAPAYLARMRRAAHDYRAWAARADTQDLPDFTPFDPGQLSSEDVSVQLREQDMESSKQGPELVTDDTKDQSTQTDLVTSDAKHSNTQTVKTEAQDLNAKIVDETVNVQVNNGGDTVKQVDEGKEGENDIREEKKAEKNEKIEDEKEAVKKTFNNKTEVKDKAESKETSPTHEGDSDKCEEENNDHDLTNSVTVTEPDDVVPTLDADSTPVDFDNPGGGTTQTAAEPDAAAVEENTSVLDSDILEILGIDPTNTNKYGKELQKDLAIRFEHIATNGLTKETRKELTEKYLVPCNCKLSEAPALNLEVKAALSETVIKRDKAIETKQKITAAAISSLGEAITCLLSSKNKDTELLRMLMDTGRMLCDSQHNDSVTRRNYVMTSVKKEMKDSLHNTKIDGFLFGNNLFDTLKTAKAINKSGAELKAPPVKTTFNKNVTPSTSKNWKNPAARKAAASSYKTRATTSAATKSQQHVGSSRPSSNQRPSRSRH